MSLYDQVQQTQSPYMSQFVGSIVPELNSYSAAMQKRYDTAADSDDALGEALGNLQHLNLDADSQYANELKNTYYNRLQDRAASGDFENMGRRTRQDAIRFSQAYMPLVQRQKDLAEVVKKVNSDPNIADPDKKAQILQYIQHLNTPEKDPTTGDYVRDGSGRINLGAIQDWSYAKDVDINKKLADLLSKKEADIRQSGFSSDGDGLKISSVQELRSPAMMAKLARQMMATDPEIKAMLNRDVTLQNYKLSDQDVANSLKSSDLSPYQMLKKQGLNDKQIATLAQHNGMDNTTLNTSTLKSQKAQYMASGMSEAAANRAILNEQTKEQMVEPHANFIGGLLAVDKRKLDARNDDLFVMRAKHALDQADQGSFQLMSVAGNKAEDNDPGKITTNLTQSSKLVDGVRTNLNSAIMSAMKQAGVATGDPVKDTALASQYANDPTKLNQLKDKLNDKDLAGRLEVTQRSYLASKDDLENIAGRVTSMEEKAGINIDKLYSKYKENPSHNELSKADFTEALRNQNSDQRSLFKTHNWSLSNSANSLQSAIHSYETKMKEANGSDATVPVYTAIDPTGSKLASQMTSSLASNIKSGLIKVRKMGTGDPTETTLADHMGLNKSKLIDKTSDDFKKMDASDIHLNTDSPRGMPTVTVTNPDGTSDQYQITDPSIVAQVNDAKARMIEQSMTAKTGPMASDHAGKLAAGLGEGISRYSKSEIESMEPSSVRYHLNDTYDFRIKPSANGKQIELYLKGTNKKIDVLNSTSDLFRNLGAEAYRNLVQKRR